MSVEYEYPEVLARFYDLIYDQMRNDMDSDYYLRKMKLAKGPVLEIGVGTGRFFTDALKSGADVYGIDNSPEMLNVLKSKIPKKEHHRVVLQNMSELNFKKKFILIVAPFRVFMHLLTIEEQLEAINRAYQHLLPGGRFIFDLFIPDFKKLGEGIYNLNDFTGEYAPGKEVRRFVSMTAEPVSQISNVVFRFVWEEDDEWISQQWTTQMRLTFRYELEHLLFRSKFKNTHIFGDYMGYDLKKDSKDFVVVCTR